MAAPDGFANAYWPRRAHAYQFFIFGGQWPAQ
jgi:hypothetical protein